jgi:hypothetical protein
MEYVSINPAAVLGPVLGPDFSIVLEVVKLLIELCPAAWALAWLMCATSPLSLHVLA